MTLFLGSKPITTAKKPLNLNRDSAAFTVRIYKIKVRILRGICDFYNKIVRFF